MQRYRSLSFSLILTMVVLLAAASCQDRGEEPSKRNFLPENTLRWDVPNPIQVTRSHPWKSDVFIFAEPLIYSRLFVRDETGQLQPDLATEWTYDRNTRILAIHLRSNALFHDGKPVTCNDVSYNILGKLETESPADRSLISRIQPVSPSTLEVFLKGDDPRIIRRICETEITPQQTSAQPIGSGPYRFEYAIGTEEMGLVANGDYFGGRPAIDRIILHHEPNATRSWAKLLEGATDIITGLYPKDYEMIQTYRDNFHFDTITSEFYSICYFNTCDPLFIDPKVRQALSMAVDKEQIVKKILHGLGKVALGPMGVDAPCHNPELQPVPYDPPKAAALLKETGWTYDEESHCLSNEGKCFEFSILLFEGFELDKKVGELIKFFLNDVGIRVILRGVPYDELTNRYFNTGDFQAVLTEFRDAHRDPENLLGNWSTRKTNTSVVGCLHSSLVTRLLQQAGFETDSSKKEDLYCRAEAIISSLHPGIILYHKTLLDVMSKRIDLPYPFKLDWLGISRLRFAAVKR